MSKLKKVVEEDSDDDEDGIETEEEVMRIYLSGQNGANEDQRVAEIMKKLNIDANENLEDDINGDDKEFKDAESNAIDEIVKSRKDHVSDEYRLFESIVKKNQR